MANNNQSGQPGFVQKLYDNPFLLLALGLIVMFVFYTGWGFFEILTLPKATLP